MTREEKIAKRQYASFVRKNKRVEKDRIYYLTAYNNNMSSISWGRKKYKGLIFTCEMGYGDCELRGYCNGDC